MDKVDDESVEAEFVEEQKRIFMKMKNFGEVVQVAIVVGFFVLYALGGYQLITDDKYTGKDIAIGVVIFPYPAWVGAKEVYAYASRPSVNQQSIQSAPAPTSSNDKSTSADKGRLWNEAMDTLQEVIDLGQQAPSSQSQADGMETKLRAALGAARAFVNATKLDQDMEVVAFRELYLIGLEGMLEGLMTKDSALFKQGSHKVNVFLEKLKSRATK